MKKNSKIYLLDTNIVLRYLLQDNPEQFDIANKLMNEIENGIIKAKIIESVLCEIVYVLDKVYKIPKDKIVETIEDLLSYKGFIETTKLKVALSEFSKTNIDIVDCILFAYSKLSEKECVVTFDKKLKTKLGL